MATNPLKTENTWLTKILSGLFAIGLMISSFFLNQTCNTISEIKSDVYSLKCSSKESFKNSDAMIHQQQDDAKRLIADRQIMRLEETSFTIKESLNDIKAYNIRMEKKLDNHMYKDNSTSSINFNKDNVQ